MSQAAIAEPPSRKIWPRTITWGIGIISFGLLIAIISQLIMQFFSAPTPHRVEIVQDIPLPGVFSSQFVPFAKNVPSQQDPLAPGVAIRFDHFDFQTIDPQTHLLFIAHTGPAPDKEHLLNPAFDATKDAAKDGHVVVFDTLHNKVVGRVDVPQITGIKAVSEQGVVYAADGNDSIIYMIDEHSLKATAIPVKDNDSPDAVEYDPVDHKIFVSDPGVAAPNADNVSPDNQNLAVIDIRTNKVSYINLGHLPKLPGESADLVKFGYDVGHNKFDPVLHRIFVTTQQLTNQATTPPALPPSGTGEVVEVDPVTQQVLRRVQLPNNCNTPHGMSIDNQQNIAYIACMGVDSDHGVVQQLVRVDVKNMHVIPTEKMILGIKPDMVIVDNSQNVVLVGCNTIVSVFDIQGGNIRKINDYTLGKGTHTIALDETTQLIYIPLVESGGRPVLRIAKYNPNGI